MADRIKAIADRIKCFQSGQITEAQLNQEFSNSHVSEAEVQAAIALVQPEPTLNGHLLVEDLLVVGDTIGAAIQRQIGGKVAFLRTQSVSSYRVHLMRFQATHDSNVKSLSQESTMAQLRNMVSLPVGTLIEITPAKYIGQPGYIDVIIPREDEEFVVFGQKHIPAQNLAGKPPQLIVGKDLYGNNILLEQFIHLLTVGESGSGKSNFLKQIVATLSYWYPPSHIRFAFVDLAKRTFSRYENYAWCLQPPLLTADQDAFDSFKRKLEELYDKRQTQFRFAEDILTWNRENPDKPEPIIFLMIEELGRLIEAFGREAVDQMLIRYAEDGRANGVYLIIGAQRPAADQSSGVLHPRVIDNMQTIVAFRCGLKTANLIRYPQAVNLRGKGHGRIRIDGQWKDFQAYWMGADNGQSIVSGLDGWARQRWPEHCYRKPTAAPIAPSMEEADAWDEPDPKDDPDWPKYEKYLKNRAAFESGSLSKSELLKRVFVSAPQHKTLQGGTLKRFEKMLDQLIKKFDGITD